MTVSDNRAIQTLVDERRQAMTAGTALQQTEKKQQTKKKGEESRVSGTRVLAFVSHLKNSPRCTSRKRRKPYTNTHKETDTENQKNTMGQKKKCLRRPTWLS